MEGERRQDEGETRRGKTCRGKEKRETVEGIGNIEISRKEKEETGQGRNVLMRKAVT